MRIFIKSLLFLCLIIAIVFFSLKLNQSLNKELRFGEEYIGISESELIKEFGDPDSKYNMKFKENTDDFHYFFEYFKNDCNQNIEVSYLLYDNFLIDYEFWLIKNEVVLVK